MKKEFFFNMALLVGINLLIKPFYTFGIDLEVQNRLGSESYGFYYALFNLSFLFQIVGDMGLQQFNNRFIAQSPQLLSKYLGRFLLVKVALSILFFLLSFIFALAIGYESAQLKLLPLLLLNQILISTILFLRSNLSGLQLFRIDSLLSVLDKFILIGIMLFLLYGPWANAFQLKWFIYAQSFALLTTLMVVAGIVFRQLENPTKWRFRVLECWVILRKSGPYALVVFLMTAYTRADVVMLERLLEEEQGAFEVGVYAFGYRLLDAFNMIAYLFAGLLLPMYARMLKQKEPIHNLLQMAFKWLFFLTFSLSLCVYFYADPLANWMLDTVTPSIPSVMIILLCTSNAVGIIYVFGSLLTADGKLKQMNWVFAISLGLNLIANSFFIPLYGAWGAAVVTLVTQFFVAIAEMYLVYKLINTGSIFFNLSLLKQVMFFLTGSWIIFYLMNQGLGAYWDWRLLLVTSGFLSFLFAEIIGFLELKGLFQLLKSKRLK